ncbi:hypothetical protein NHH03_09795 [Stieleria sp. TO1_6]|uniref:hypothetical protein n=1 Tax=Stieleria tagensis TaxID=2956795 RepID=UPI00209AF96D|nr:hypothetical protein [Stieleria tagensis]MCO8122029.1 hypothetical protein [Stieleria tagensis]
MSAVFLKSIESAAFYYVNEVSAHCSAAQPKSRATSAVGEGGDNDGRLGVTLVVRHHWLTRLWFVLVGTQRTVAEPGLSRPFLFFVWGAALPSNSPLRRPLVWILVLIAISGMVSSLIYNRKLVQLRQQRNKLAVQVGTLEVADPSRVYISRIPTGPDDIPPGVQAAHLWKFRLYLPAGYSPCFISSSGAVTADSPRSDGGSNSSWGGKKPDPVETYLTVALIKTETGWLFSRNNQGSASSSSVSDELDFESMEQWIVETVVTAENPSKSFSADQPICLLRVRATEPKPSKPGQPDLYPGLVTYLIETDRRAAFEQWANGRVDQMPEVQP